MTRDVAARNPKARHTLRRVVDLYLESPAGANGNTAKSYRQVLDRVAGTVGPSTQFGDLWEDQITEALKASWGESSPATWNQRRTIVRGFLAWAQRQGYPAPQMPVEVERRKVHVDKTRALTKTEIRRWLTDRSIPLRERTLWGLLYESISRASEVLRLDIGDLDPGNRRAAVRVKGGDTRFVFWEPPTSRRLGQLLRGRTAGPVFVTDRKPPASAGVPERDLCPTTGRARLSYDTARQLFKEHTGRQLHQLRHSGATHLGEAGVSAPLIMARGGWESINSVARYVRPGPSATAETGRHLDLS